jgi:tRNA A-37 threonylcarbamoyl transferase component Bud32
MSEYPSKDETIGPYRGRVAGSLRSPEFLLALVRVPALINHDDAEVLTTGRNRNLKIDLVFGGRTLSVVVKSFGTPSSFKNAVARRRGSKARRSWLAATHLAEAGVGTPQPVAFFERWTEERLVESYLITVYQEAVSSFALELNTLFRQDSECSKVMALMQVVADGIRAMHHAGFLHNDLGNQNILLRRGGDGGWQDVQFIDLNRGRILSSLTPRDRARDISRVYLPSDLLRVFKEMVYDSVPPDEFKVWEKRYRDRYAWHSATRRYRHPIREWKRRAKSVDSSQLPAERDLWLWDERSGQAQTTLLSKDRSRYYSPSRIGRIVVSSLKGIVPIWKEYRRLLAGAYTDPITMKSAIGVAVEPTPDRFDRQLALLSELGAIPVFVRFYHHRSHGERDYTVAAVRRLYAAGHAVSIALVQDRAAVKDSSSWQQFADDVLSRVGDIVDTVEIGHAINRVKWGIWNFSEYRNLVASISVLRSAYPELTLTGPAVIDFEYPCVMAALDCLPAGFSFGALSHHLYVDRRGAPENRQGRFAALEKFALGRAIARVHRHCCDRLIVSEVNWPLRGTGVYSPVGSPYVSAEPRRNDPSVSEDEYADYMIRYLLIALCSGMVERVFWWRLVAYGFGLVDDSNETQWRERPAFKMLKVLLEWVGKTTYQSRIELTDAGAVAF